MGIIKKEEYKIYNLKKRRNGKLDISQWVKIELRVIHKWEKKVAAISAINSICWGETQKTVKTIHCKVNLATSMFSKKILQLNVKEKLLPKSGI